MAYLDPNCKANTLFVGGWEPPLPVATAAAGLVHHYMAPVWEDQGANIHQHDPGQEWILHWQWSCSEGNAVIHSRGKTLLCNHLAPPSVPTNAVHRLVEPFCLSVRLSSPQACGCCSLCCSWCWLWSSTPPVPWTAPTCFESLTQVLPPKPSFNSLYLSVGVTTVSSDCFWKVASALGSDGGTQSHLKKGTASSGRNSLLGKCGHLVSAKQRWDIGGAKLRAEGLAPEREVSADGAVGKAELGFPIRAL